MRNQDDAVPSAVISSCHNNSHSTNESVVPVIPIREESSQNEKKKPINACVTHLTEGYLHNGIKRCVVAFACHAARHPVTWIATVTALSFGLAVTGLLTNFTMELDQMTFLTPQGSLPDRHSDWIFGADSGFEKLRVLWIALHADGDNVLHAQAMRQAIAAMEMIQTEVPDFHTVCANSLYLDFETSEPTCRIFTVTQFWNDNLTLFEEELAAIPISTPTIQDEYVRWVVSREVYPDGTPVFHEAILGKYENTTTEAAEADVVFASQASFKQPWIITSARALVIKIDIPDLGKDTDELEIQLLDKLSDLKRHWTKSPDTASVKLEYFTFNAYQAEFQRAIDQDMILVVVLIVVMISFTVFVFYKPKEKVQSRGLLGVFAFATIGCSLLTGYGIMFVAGVPLTNIGIMIPFVVVGIALDDTFIITGAYFRIRRDNPKGDMIEIVHQTMNECAVSISMTTITTLICFLSGVASTIPAVKWLCLYAATTVAVDFIYQITLFIAFLTLDERRVQANHRDLCFWVVVEQVEEEVILKDTPSTADEGSAELQNGTENGAMHDMSSGDRFSEDEERILREEHTLVIERNFMERFMSRYADVLLKPWVKVTVLTIFFAYFGGCVYSTTKLYQEFNVGDYVPHDSYLTSFMTVFQQYTTVQRYIGVYFRDVDQSDPDIQQQMTQYVQELADLPQIGEGPPFFWVRDFPALAESDEAAELGFDVSNLTFNEKIDVALSIPQVRQVFAQDIVRDKESGNITASRTYLQLRHVNMYEVTNQIDMLLDQRRITQSQPINSPENVKANGGELPFFTFDDLYYFWELYDITVNELIFTTVTCVAVVSAVSFIMIPHWSAILFVTPLIIALYFCLLGTMQYCGIKVNSITYFIIVIAIGLLVDFLMHILLRYYESKGRSRHEKVKETLQTMGTSILLGGFTTWLGVIPLAFSSTEIFMTVFISFFAMVTLGCSVGIAVLPVFLSIVGPVDRETKTMSAKLPGPHPSVESTSNTKPSAMHPNLFIASQRIKRPRTGP